MAPDGRYRTFVTPPGVMASMEGQSYQKGGVSSLVGVCPIEQNPGPVDVLCLWLQPLIDRELLAASPFTLWLSRKEKTEWSCLKGSNNSTLL